MASLGSAAGITQGQVMHMFSICRALAGRALPLKGACTPVDDGTGVPTRRLKSEGAPPVGAQLQTTDIHQGLHT